eukprot:c18462_g1_i1.p1 GENE.c18462_g1_i1~~c18462_g1_i1.p1  ORF type:complete len:265 (-),score=85.29 c18462_g1_i1:39-833(-)
MIFHFLILACFLLLLNCCHSFKIHDYSRKGDFDGVKAEIENGVDVNIQEDFTQMTPLMVSCIHNQTNIVKYLLFEKNANVHITDKNRYTPIDGASYKGATEIVKLLLKYEPNLINYKQIIDGFNPLHRVAFGRIHEQGIETAKILLEFGFPINDQTTTELQTPLMIACKNGNVGLVKIFVSSKNIQINQIDDLGQTALHKATKIANKDIVEVLLQNGIDTQIKDKEGKIARDFAPQSGVKRLPWNLFDELENKYKNNNDNKNEL